jgi:TPP-dependent pyruvate/acetoin dehydrogenase alpha subunit
MITFNSSYEELFYQSLRIRLVEQKIIELYPSDKIQSPVHLSIGQESVAVTLCSQLRDDDWVFINYRGHAFYLAKKGPMPELFAELFGKRTGLSKGKAGSMHLADPKHGLMGSSAVVGSTISHAVGAALASKIRGEKRVFVAVFGDGATEQGVYHESLNFASLHKLPILFLCENNGLAVHASLAERQSYNLLAHARSYGIESTLIEESYNFTELSDFFSLSIEKIREHSLPLLVEVKTCRYKEHVGTSDDFQAGYRSIQEVRDWQLKDPLINDKTLIDKFIPFIQKEIDMAVIFAEESPFPTIDDLLTDIF